MPANFAQTLKSKTITDTGLVVINDKTLATADAATATEITDDTTGGAVTEAIQVGVLPTGVASVDITPAPWAYNYRIDLTPYTAQQQEDIRDEIFKAFYAADVQFISDEVGGVFLLHNDPTLVNTLIYRVVNA